MIITGKARGVPDTAFEPRALARGITAELDQVNNYSAAKEIAKEKLLEDPQCYDAPALLENPVCACGGAPPVQDNPEPPPALAEVQENPAPAPVVEVQDNLADLSVRTEVETAEVGRVEICNASYCRTGDFLVRGKRAEFVSVEQVKRVGRHKLDPSAMPSDVRLPPSLVVAHDSTGKLLSPCDIYFLKWRATPGGAKRVDPDTLRAFRGYYGNNAVPRVGELSMPRGRWRRTSLIKFIRYSRAGYSVPFEHEYAEAVWLYASGDSEAWRLSLPEGCVIDSRGFVRP